MDYVPEQLVIPVLSVRANSTDYDKRMQGVFNTPDYIGAVAQILEPQDIDSLQRIEDRQPGVNPLASELSKYLKELEAEKEQSVAA